MDVLMYVVVGVAVVIGGWWVLKVVVGLGLPLENTAYAYFSQLLKKMGLADVVPPACVAECVAESVQFARSSGKMLGKGQRHARMEAVKQLELHADMLGFWIQGTDPFDVSYKIRYKEMFERHRVPCLPRQRASA